MTGPAVSLSVCPSAIVDAPVQRVWEHVTRPDGFDTWLDVRLVSADPDGPARAGQRLLFDTRALGRRFPIRIDVRDVDEPRHRLHLLVGLPFGIVNDEHLTLSPGGDRRTLVRFG